MYVGVILPAFHQSASAEGIPHVCGGDPHCTLYGIKEG